ncbi:MAG: MFS transporter [Trueperaceae bacterium]|nr:MFS transporter [Trueperaceae bacterium]
MNLSARDKALTLTGILLAVFLGALDQTIVATALPKIVEDLQGVSRYAWVATAYLLASTVLVPIYGKLADMFSRKRIVLFAIATFLLGSALSGVAGEFGTLPLLGDGMSQLIVFRAVQGLGGAGLFSLAFIVIADLFSPRERGKFQGLVGATFGVASVLGPWIGGLLTDYGGALIPGIEGWRWVFYVNVPVGGVALWFVATRMPPLRPRDAAGRLDVPSALFLVGALVPFVLALQLDRAVYPWGGAVTLGAFAAAAAFAVAFVLRSLASASPVLEVRLFANRVFATANVAAFLLGAAFLSTVIFLPLFMVNVVGVSATRAGLSLIPLSIGTVLGSVFAGQIASRLGRYKGLMVFGGVVLLLAMFLLSTMSADVPYWRVTLYMVIAGLGVGPGLPLYTLAIQNAIDPRKVGQATSAAQFFRQIGGAVGAAVMGTILATTLAAAFAGVGRTAAATGLEAPAFAGGELASTGGGDVGAAVREAFGAQAEALVAALEDPDAQALARALEASAVPDEARGFILGAATRARGDAAATAALAAQLRVQLDEQAEAVASTVAEAIRQGFADAVTAIFGALLWVVAAALVATALVPSLELRRSNEPVAAAPE